MASFGERLSELRNRHGFSQAVVAAAINVDRSTIARWEAGVREPDYQMAVRLADFFRVSVDYLLGRTDDPRQPPPARGLESPLPDAVPLKRVPLVGRAPAGPPLFAEENSEGYVPAPADLDCDFAVRISGDSMEGAGFRHGDIVFCVSTARQRPQPGDMVVAVVNGEVTVKWLLQDVHGKFYLRAANPRYADIPLNGQDYVQGVVVGSLRGKPRYPGMENELAATKE